MIARAVACGGCQDGRGMLMGMWIVRTREPCWVTHSLGKHTMMLKLFGEKGHSAGHLAEDVSEMA